MSEIRALRKQVKAEAKAFKQSANDSISCASAESKRNLGKRSAERTYRSEVKALRRAVAAETASMKALLN